MEPSQTDLSPPKKQISAGIPPTSHPKTGESSAMLCPMLYLYSMLLNKGSYKGAKRCKSNKTHTITGAQLTFILPAGVQYTTMTVKYLMEGHIKQLFL
jgi:hypothetical protein